MTAPLPEWWQWTPGMRVIDEHGRGYRICLAGDACSDDGDDIWINVHDGGAYLPDTTDAATIGALLGVVRAMWGCPLACTRTVPRAGGFEWYVSGLPCGVAPTRGATEWDAIIAAGDAAARRTA